MKLDAAALLAVAAPKPKKKQYASSAGGGVGNKKAAAAAAAAGAAYTALWKHTGPPREPRIVREAGIEYEEVSWLPFLGAVNTTAAGPAHNCTLLSVAGSSSLGYRS